MNQFVRSARDGDPRAKRLLIDSLNSRITKMAYYYARRTGEDPDDLLQEAWLGLLEALPNLDMRIGSPEQYLIKHARWRLLDAIKRAKVRRCLSLEDTLEPDRISDECGDDAESEACVLEFADQLKTTQRDVLRCLLSGLTWREAGQKLGCTSANIAYYVRQIRKQYEEWAEDTVCSI